ncbi:unnamed protein product [Brassica rapa]|uniref:cellulase n=1 Tax=Brassica campestris TaxID=3711 RepID=A0A8D9GIF0_BRACM|nr:unnamed protein product [Brassica rapa]
MYCVLRTRSSQCFLTIQSMCIVLLLLSTSGKVSAGLNYGEALTKSLLYFEAQRSGKLPSDQRVQWRGDSAPGDGSDVHIDLSGGYYDAGDNMKFGFPLAFTTTMLAWGSVEMASQFQAHNEHQNVLVALKWATDYLIKAHPEPNVLYGQVGDGKLDHACWMRPEDMNTSHPRPSYRIDAQHPGADLAAETAAAMAAASLAFAPSDAAYANTLISHAKDLFEFGKNHPGVYHDSITNAAGFYSSSGHEDELLWAAAWLHRATGDQMYLDYLTQASNSGGVRSAFSWDDKFVGAQVLAAKLVFEGKVKNEGKMAEYKSMAEHFICNCAQKGYSNVKKTPGGLLWFLPWENLQYTATASFVLSSYSKYLEAAQASVQCPNGVLQAFDLLSLARAQDQSFVMDYESFDSSGTDDDLPPSHRVVPRGGIVSSNGRPSTLAPSHMYDQVAADMEAQIHHVEKEAYFSLLRAFRAQADAITWEKDGLITEMRKELRVSHEEHRELLAPFIRFRSKTFLFSITREWRQSGGVQRHAAQVVHDTLPSPCVPASIKRHKPNQPIPSQPFASSSPPQADPTHQFSSWIAKRGLVPSVKDKKHKPVLPGSSSLKPIPNHPLEQPPRGQVMNNRLPSGPTSSSEPAKGSGPESFVGRRVRTRWPEDNAFYEAAITKYDPVEGRHALVYDIGTRNETWEWVKLAEISPRDIEWIGEDPGVSNRYGLNRTTGPNNVPQRGSGLAKTTIKNDLRTSQNGAGKRKHVDIRIRPTNVLIREVERVLGSHNPDPQEVEMAKRVLEEQEHALVGAITKLGDISNGENGNFAKAQCNADHKELMKKKKTLVEMERQSLDFFDALVTSHQTHSLLLEDDAVCLEKLLWILENVENQEWSRKTFKYPRQWEGFGWHLRSNGLIHTGELMVFQRSLEEAKPFCVYYYDFNKERSRKVEIRGVETDELQGSRLCYPGYVENIRFL